jgi:methionine sulfoxide reductase heme-binding subunit
LIWLGAHARLGVNPVEYVEHDTGLWALRFFLITLACRPAAKLLGWSWWMQRRRLLGLFVTFYAAIHFLTYLFLDMELNWGDFFRDVKRRPYILIGFASLVLLVPLTVTSTDWAIRRLKLWWGRLHALVYPAAILGATHFWFVLKKDKTRAWEYAAVLGLLLGYRVIVYVRAKLPAAPSAPPAPAAGA